MASTYRTARKKISDALVKEIKQLMDSFHSIQTYLTTFMGI